MRGRRAVSCSRPGRASRSSPVSLPPGAVDFDGDLAGLPDRRPGPRSRWQALRHCPALTHSAAAPTARSTRTTSIFHMGGDCTGSSRDSHSVRRNVTRGAAQCCDNDRNQAARRARARSYHLDGRRRASAYARSDSRSDDSCSSLAAVDECFSPLRGSRRDECTSSTAVCWASSSSRR